jgi:CubicO group peptidase (beta-lactamase class C family)
MPRRLARHEAAAASLGSLTIGQLLTHRSGLPRAPDGEEIPGLRAQLRTRPPRSLTTEDLAPALLATQPTRPAGEAYEYSNINFLRAGLAVEEAAGEPYAVFVAREVLGRVGIRRATLDAGWGLLGATGGWSLSAPEYLALMLRGLQGETLVPAPVRRWMDDPDGKAIAAGGAVFYSLGLLGRPVSGGLNRWHAGSWRVRWPAWQVDESAGTFAVLAADRAAWFASYTPFPGEAALAELDRLLWAGRRAEPAGSRADSFGTFVDPPR